MSIFKKKEVMPRIPDAPILPRANIEPKKDAFELPSLQGDVRNVSNRSMIKSAIEDAPAMGAEESYPVPFIPSIDIQNHTIQESSIEQPLLPQSIPFPEPHKASGQNSNVMMMADSKDKKNGKSAFIKFDEYYSARNEVQDIKSILESISLLVESINEIKSREDIEIKELESEIDRVKEKFNKVDSKIFNKI